MFASSIHLPVLYLKKVTNVLHVVIMDILHSADTRSLNSGEISAKNLTANNSAKWSMVQLLVWRLAPLKCSIDIQLYHFPPLEALRLISLKSYYNKYASLCLRIYNFLFSVLFNTQQYVCPFDARLVVQKFYSFWN